MQDELKRLTIGIGGGPHPQAITNQEDLLTVITILLESRGLKRPVLREKLCERNVNADVTSLNRSIDLGLRLCCMVNVRETAFKMQTSQIPAVQWDDESTLQNFIDRLFPATAWPITHRDGRVDPYFTAANMVRVCGLKLRWTSSLEDHWRFDRRAKVLWVFPYKKCLKRYIEGHKSNQSPLLPLRVLTETMDSLNLLFPHWDDKTISLLHKHKQTFYQVGSFHGPRSLDLHEFVYWRDRILEVYEEVFRSPPASWAQLWSDQRNPQQWWTFWIALVILALTVVSTAASLVQAWAAMKTLDCG